MRRLCCLCSAKKKIHCVEALNSVITFNNVNMIRARSGHQGGSVGPGLSAMTAHVIDFISRN
jgi:hypothetical protein